MFLDQCLLLSWYEIITFRSISRELAKKINCDQKTIVNHLHSMRFAKKLGVWVPHELSENKKENCLQIASQHLARHRATRYHKQSLLYRIVTGDEKCYLYINMKQEKNGWLLEIRQSRELSLTSIQERP